MAEQWQSRAAQGFKTFADPVEDTVADCIKRRNAKINGSDQTDASTQPPFKEVSTYACECCTLRESQIDCETTAEYFYAFFLSTAAPHALTDHMLSLLRAVFLIDMSGQKIKVAGKWLREASTVMLAALEALHLANLLVVVETLKKANFRAFSATAGKLVTGVKDCLKGVRNG